MKRRVIRRYLAGLLAAATILTSATGAGDTAYASGLSQQAAESHDIEGNSKTGEVKAEHENVAVDTEEKDSLQEKSAAVEQNAESGNADKQENEEAKGSAANEAESDDASEVKDTEASGESDSTDKETDKEETDAKETSDSLEKETTEVGETAAAETTEAAETEETKETTGAAETTLASETTEDASATTTETTETGSAVTTETTAVPETTVAEELSPAFSAKQVVNGITISAQADAGVLPEGATLKVTPIREKVFNKYKHALTKSIDLIGDLLGSIFGGDVETVDYTYDNDTTIDHAAGSEDQAVAQYNTRGNHPDQDAEPVPDEENLTETEKGFDIKILDKYGHEVQPDTSMGTVRLSFSADEFADEDTEIKVYHVKEDQTDLVASTKDGDTVSLDADSFSPYILKLSAPSSQEAVNAWGWSAYYIGETDTHEVTKTNNFNLKYQVEFHTSESLDEGSIQITIPAKLMDTRAGKEILPADVAVPKITESDAENGNYKTSNKSTPFNYYLDDNGNMVFVNYDAVSAGTNTAFQVLYKNVDVMQIEDNTTWSIEPEILVTKREKSENDEEKVTRETQNVEPLTGTTDTAAKITGITMNRYQRSGASYTPGLYTTKQVTQFIAKYAEGMSADSLDFTKYKYVVWKATVEGRGTQPAKLTLKDIPAIDQDVTDCNIVGYSVNYITPDSDDNGSAAVSDNITSTSWKYEFYIVTAYPSKDVVSGQTVFTNQAAFTLHPKDKIDPDQTMTAQDQWTYVDYKWTYLGDNLYIDKDNTDHQTQYSSTLTAYKYYLEHSDSPDYGSFPYTIHTHFRAYDTTHWVTMTEQGDGTKAEVGKYIPGTAYEAMVTDDVVYAYPTGRTMSWDNRLTGDDYYFSKVTVTRQDQGYDVNEDTYADVEMPDDVDQTMTVFAKFAGSEEWESVGTAELDPKTGTSEYKFTDDQIAKMPWQVKAVYRGINYSSDCYITTTLCLRSDSEKLRNLLKKTEDSSEVTKLTLENVGGISAQALKNITSENPTGEANTSVNGDSWLHSQSTDKGNYSEPGLQDYTSNNYGGILLQRDNAYDYLTDLEKKAESSKTAAVVNDSDHSRTNVTYTLASYEGYKVFDTATVNQLTSIGVPIPNRTDVTYYDLLPYGVQFDASKEVTVGRVSSLNQDYWKKQPRSWNTKQISLSQRPELISNWRNTGRTMVIFHLHYDGASSAVFDHGQWFSGFGVSFGAYYEWQNQDEVVNTATTNDFANQNIAAYIPDDTADVPIYGADGDFWHDDGREKNGEVLSGTYADFNGGDLDQDGNAEETLLYAHSEIPNEDIAVSTTEGIEKKVRADNQISSSFESKASVETGEGYTYELTVNTVNTTSNIKNLVVFDRLENPYDDLSKGDADNSDLKNLNETNTWKGTLRGVIVKGAEEAGINPKVYVAESDLIPKSDNGSKIVDMRGFPETGWSQLNGDTDLSQVRAVAVDLRTTKTGDEYVLEGGHSVSIEIQMTAPQEVDSKRIYACNNAVLVSSNLTDDDMSKENRSVSDAAMVSLGKSAKLIVEKKIKDKDKVPELRQQESFGFSVKNEEVAFDHKVYTLEEKDGDTWKSVDNQLHSTDSDGRLWLKDGQRAVFSGLTTAIINNLTVTEDENPFWKLERNEINTKETDTTAQEKTILFSNTYQTLIYFNKKLESVPKNVNVDDKTFSFMVTGPDGEPADLDYWYVKEKKSGSSIPTKDTSKGTGGTGNTGETGIFAVKAGDTLAFFGQNIGTQYTFTELTSTNPVTPVPSDGTVSDDFYCEIPSVTVTTAENSVAAQITNIYRWRDLILHKNVLHQDEDEAKQSPQPFTFQIKDQDGNPLTGNEWSVLDDEGNALTGDGQHGTLGEDGTFTAAIADRSVIIKHLEAGKTYTITEIADPDDKDYAVVNGGSVNVTMPKYGLTPKKAEITNTYLKRPIFVSKSVAFSMADSSSIQNKKFTFKVKVNGVPLQNASYAIYKGGACVEKDLTTGQDGTVQITTNETARIQDAGHVGDLYSVTERPENGYPQLVPADRAPVEGKIDEDGDANAHFVNGTPGTLVIGKVLNGDDADYFSKQYKFRFKLEFMLDGTWEVYKGKLNYLDSYNYKNVSSDEDGIFLLEPGKSYILHDKKYENAAYRITEVDSPQDLSNKVLGQNSVFYEIQRQQKGWYSIQQTNPLGGKVLTGTVKDNPFATITNTVTKLEEKSVIYKRFSGLENQLPKQGNTLKFIVERYTGAAWVPAEGVSYFLAVDGDGHPDADSAMLKTDSDGMVYITMGTQPVVPRIIFPMDDVKINPDPISTGTLRITEASDNDSTVWGILQGYDLQGSAEQIVSMSLKNADTFVNSVETSEIEVEKMLPENTESDETFTFNLNQVTDWAGTEDRIPDGYNQSEHTTAAGKAINYNVYDRVTDQLLDSGTTSDSGEFTLKGGQYARFTVPQSTLWSVRENSTKSDGFQMTGAEGNLDTSGKTKTGLHSVLLLADKAEPIVTLHYENGTVTKVRKTELDNSILNKDIWYLEPTYRNRFDPSTIESINKDIDLYQTNKIIYISFSNIPQSWRELVNRIDKSFGLDGSQTRGSYSRPIEEGGWRDPYGYGVYAYSKVMEWGYPDYMDWGFIWSFDDSDYTVRIRKCENLFKDYPKLESIWGLGAYHVDYSEVDSMKGMFQNDVALYEVTAIKDWNVSNVLTTQYMFENDKNLHVVDLSGWHTSGKLQAEYMFDNTGSVDSTGQWNKHSAGLEVTLGDNMNLTDQIIKDMFKQSAKRNDPLTITCSRKQAENLDWKAVKDEWGDGTVTVNGKEIKAD